MKTQQCSETSAYKIQAPGNYPEEIIQLFLFFFFLTSSSHFTQLSVPPTSISQTCLYNMLNIWLPHACKSPLFASFLRCLSATLLSVILPPSFSQNDHTITILFSFHSGLFNNAVKCWDYLVSVIDEWVKLEHWWSDTNWVKPIYSVRNLSQCQSILQKPSMDWPWIESRTLQWETGD